MASPQPAYARVRAILKSVPLKGRSSTDGCSDYPLPAHVFVTEFHDLPRHHINRESR
jgi:hypothetical protein